MTALGHAEKMLDTLRFTAQFVRCHARTGALAPSSQRLARAMARLAHQHRHPQCTLVELGPGTGSITREIDQCRFAEYIAFESNREFARLFRSRFPALAIHPTAVPAPISESCVGKPCVVLSSIPFRSLDQSEHHTVADYVERLVLAHAGNYLVQYSYLPLPPFKPSQPGLRWRRQQIVALNLPPAFLWLLEHADAGRPA